MDGRGSGNDIILACTIGDLSWLKRGISSGISPTATNDEGLNGLHLAARYGHMDCIKYLLDTDRSIDVNCSSLSTGSTALHYSIPNDSKNFLCTKLLLSRGANLKSQNKLGETPTHIAAKHGHIKLVKLFLEMGTSIHIEDKGGHTPYDTACVHNQHKCARLLRALQWANKKDRDDREKLQREEVTKRQTMAKIALQKRLRKEAADASYNEWLEKKGMEAEEKSTSQEGYSRPTFSSRAASKHSVTSVQKRIPQFTSAIKLNPKQAKRNLTSIGKPDKMQPYTNYPTKSSLRRASMNYLGKSRSEPSKSGRSSRATVRSAASVPASVRYYNNNVGRRHTALKQNGDKVQTKEDFTESTKESHECVSDVQEDTLPTVEKQEFNESTERLNKFTCQRTETDLYEQQLVELEINTDYEDKSKVQMVAEKDKNDDNCPPDVQYHAAWDDNQCDNYSQPEEEVVDELDFSKLEDVFVNSVDYPIGEEEDLFHDVGQTNSLNALSLPSTLTKDRTPAEIVQLLRSFGGLSRYNRSNSFSYTHSTMHRTRMQRRFSLGAIPEGKIVTSYSDDEQSTSQLLDSQFLESLIFNLTSDSTKENKILEHSATTQKSSKDDTDDEKESLDSSYILSDGSETLSGSTPSISSLNNPETDQIAEDDKSGEHQRDYSLDLPIVTGGGSQDDRLSPVSHPQSLKVVNLAWDPLSNSVLSHISASPLSPPDFTSRSGRWTPTRKVSPTNKDTNSKAVSSQGNICSGSDQVATVQLFSSRPSSKTSTLSPTSSKASLDSQKTEKKPKLTECSPSDSKLDSFQSSESSLTIKDVETTSMTSTHKEASFTLPATNYLTTPKMDPLSSKSLEMNYDNKELGTEQIPVAKSAPNILG